MVVNKGKMLLNPNFFYNKVLKEDYLEGKPKAKKRMLMKKKFREEDILSHIGLRHQDWHGSVPDSSLKTGECQPEGLDQPLQCNSSDQESKS